jgi:tRNA-specific 2-thiouridylase
VLGRHEGVTRYTVGQRAGSASPVGEPLFVVRLDADRRRGDRRPARGALTPRAVAERGELARRRPTLDAAARAGRPVLARVRSTKEPTPARLALDETGPTVVFDSPEEGVSPGQACVLYDPTTAGERVLGGGFIATTTAAA